MSDTLNIVNDISNKKKSDALNMVDDLMKSTAAEALGMYKKIVASTYFDEPLNTPESEE